MHTDAVSSLVIVDDFEAACACALSAEITHEIWQCVISHYMYTGVENGSDKILFSNA